MSIKYLTIFLCFFLSGCLTNVPGQVTVVEKSFNKIEVEQQTNKNWTLPVDSSILKNYSEKNNHLGLTFNNNAGQDVRAVRKGEVVYSGNKMTSYGKMIIIKHAFGFYSSYTQNQLLRTREGDHVEKGQVIALTGKNPFYFEMKKYSDPINPLKYLK